MTDEPLVTNVSDTARWVAVHRAVESARPDALFHDSLAGLLAGTRGREIAEAARREIADDWFLVARTKQIDDRVADAVRAGCDLVVNLGAGLDTRPYRMDLPTELEWIEVDLPGLIEEKNSLLADQVPRCQLTRVAVDVTDHVALTAFLDATLEGVHQALILSEGLVMYLDDDSVAALASALRRPQVAGWCLDFSAAGVAQLMVDRNEGLLQRAPWTFLPADGVAFFEALGWRVEYLESIFAAAGRLDRLSSDALEGLAGPQPDPRAPGQSPYSGVVELTPETRWRPQGKHAEQ
ncbi:SAM-dependent methyltransferase [Rhodococcus spelaei]|uniref:S-adenosyl-L-methionine-dependent methyltransferase n=1 Tax=Rhodococcus spelaei TaxID=2546320 RepID=A0A541B7T6_9NOCA|nr:SAM-dependent methyltransferase [Rhodococcus spelaei]TQF68379.1 SAM-dependent methyltransferase [Rhodococcus spelaei]